MASQHSSTSPLTTIEETPTVPSTPMTGRRNERGERYPGGGRPEARQPVPGRRGRSVDRDRLNNRENREDDEPTDDQPARTESAPPSPRMSGGNGDRPGATGATQSSREQTEEIQRGEPHPRRREDPNPDDQPIYIT